MDIDDVFLAKVMLASLEPVRCWPGACSFSGMALLVLGWRCTGLGVTFAVRRVPVLRHARGQGLRRTSRARCLGCLRGGGGGGGWSGGLGVDSVRDGVLPDPLALSEVVGLPESLLRPALAALYRISRRCLRFSSSTWGWSSSWISWLMVQTVLKTVWRFVVVQKTIEISQPQFIDKVLPYVVAQMQIPMVLRQCRKLRSFRSCTFTWVCGSSWTRLSSCPLRTDSVGSRRAANCGVPQLQFWTKWTCPLLRRQVHGGAVLGQSVHARCCDDRCSS